MPISYHEGELRVQARAGVRAMAERVGQSVYGSVTPFARHFLTTQRFAVASALDSGGRVWASPLIGRRGFISAPGESLVRVEAKPRPGDPLDDALRVGAPVGLIVIDLARRVRMRFNGVVLRETGSLFELEAREVYTNCPKYIHARSLEAEAGRDYLESPPDRSASLGAEQREFVAHADTFFIATTHPERGADASHRGGAPGFVCAEGGQRIVWPDYSGNAMFNTLGNLAADPRAGLLFIDFENGDTLQVGGRAGINWDEGRAAEFAGAERVVGFDVDEVVERRGALPLRWRLEEYSPFNPARP